MHKAGPLEVATGEGLAHLLGTMHLGSVQAAEGALQSANISRWCP